MGVALTLRFAVLIFFLFCGGLAKAEPSATLGIGRLFSNDFLGDGRDRWQSGSYVVSVLRGSQDALGPQIPLGAVREYRLRSGLIASDGRGPAPGDRPYVGALSFGVHLHARDGNTQTVLGVDVTAIGPQSGVSRMQRRAHDVLGMRQVRFVEQQLGNDLLFGLIAEVAEVVALTDRITVRPFAEVLSGPEDMLRVGADLRFGTPLGNVVSVRDVTTGHLYQTGLGDAGFAFVAGADVAVVQQSAYLPGKAVTDRARLRVGLHWQSRDETSLFYGLTYLSPEFDGQDGGQITGSVQLRINF